MICAKILPGMFYYDVTTTAYHGATARVDRGISSSVS